MISIFSAEPPTDQGIAGVLNFMKENADNEISIANALKHLNTYPSKSSQIFCETHGCIITGFYLS